MKRIQDCTSEREFLSKLRTFFRKCVRKGLHHDYHGINFLCIMEHVGQATPKFEQLSEKYFRVNMFYYDWINGNSLMQDKVREWYAEMNITPPKFL